MTESKNIDVQVFLFVHRQSPGSDLGGGLLLMGAERFMC